MTTEHQTAGVNHFEVLFEQLHDPVVEFVFQDDEPIIVQANPAFREVFCSGESLANLRLNELIVPNDKREQAQAFDQRTVDGKPNRKVVERITRNGSRTFLYRGVPLGKDRGFAIYTDITEKIRREKYLDVLQRVFRHNLRNDVNIISAHATQALDAAETEQARDSLDHVIETADSLAKLCTEASTIRKVLDEPVTLEPVALHTVIDTVTTDCQERFTAAEITVDCPRDFTVLADKRLPILVDSLVDNAIRHNTSSTPIATVNASIDDEMVELTIADNGPGIPPAERQIITGEKEISSLKHGSGLGLWLVRWLTERYGGSLEINTYQEGGSVVRVWLPQAE